MSWIERWRGLHWDPPGNADWLFVLLAAAVLAYSIYVYRRTDAPLRRGIRVLLTGLRALALLTLVFILCRPVISMALPGGAARGVVLLLDRTESLLLPGRDPGLSRDDELRGVVRDLQERIGDAYPLTLRPFAAELGPEPRDGELPPATGIATNLAAALEQGMAQGRDQGRPGAIILVTDGVQTDGPDPVPVARRLGVPVETVALGAATPVPDLAVTRVRANREAFTGEPTPLEAVLRLQGLGETSVRVQLLDVTDGEVELASATARLAPGGAESRVALSFRPEKAGLRFLEIRVPALDGEAAAANNRRLVAVEVREEKTGVLVLSGELTWDHTFLRRALEADSTLTVSTGIWKRGRFDAIDAGRPLPAITRAGLREVRAVVLDHVAPEQLGAAGAQTLVGFVNEGGGLLVVAGSRGRALTGWLGSALEDLLPARMVAGAPPRTATARLTVAGRQHVLFDPSVPGAPPLEAWGDLPPVGLAPGLGNARGGAEVLLSSVVDGNHLPVLSWSRAGRGRVVLLAAGGAWKWDFSQAGYGPAGNVIPTWWRRAVHWLSRPDIETRLDIHPEEFVTAKGNRVTFVARVTDDAYQPIAEAEVEVSVTPADGGEGDSARVTLSGGSGFFSGVIDGLAPGRYRYEGRARAQNEALGALDGLFAVDSLGVELERLEADHELLERVARASGGRFWSPDSLDGIQDEFASIAQSEEERVQLAVWDHPLVFVLFVLFASAEWLIRRRQGLV